MAAGDGLGAGPMTRSAKPPMCGCGCGRPGRFGRGMCQAAYERHRRRETAYGRWQPRVPVERARDYLEKLQAAGLRPAQVAELAGVSAATVRNVGQAERERISAAVEHAILAVPIPERPGDVAPDHALVPVLGARRRVQALIAHGYPQSHLARELGINPSSSTMCSLIGRPNTANGGTGQTITAHRERAIRDLFDRLQMTPGPSDRARAYGRERGWPLPFEWDEDAIDDPAATAERARWTPKSSREERREQVRDLTARGLSNPQIADHLRVTVRTVERIRHLVSTGVPQRPEQDWGLNR